MKFSRKLQTMNLFKRSSHPSRNLPMVINDGKLLRRRLGLSLLRRFKWLKKNDTSTVPLPTFVSTIRLSAPRIEALENEFMRRLKQMHYSYRNTDPHSEDPPMTERSFLRGTIGRNHSCRPVFGVNKRLLITRSVDDFPRLAHQRFIGVSRSSQPLRRPFLTRALRRSSHSDPSSVQSIEHDGRTTMMSESCLKKDQSKMSRPLSLHWDEQSLMSMSRESPAAIIEVEQAMSLCKPLQKSHSSPIPINTNHPSVNQNPIHSAHLLDQCSSTQQSGMSFYACTSAMGDTHTLTSSGSSDEDDITRSLLQYQKKVKQDSLRHRWCLSDMWKMTRANLPSIFNCVWRQRVHLTGSREFLLEYDETLPTHSNNMNNNHRSNLHREERYVEQERPIHSHIGLALFSLLVFPPVGILAIILSAWSLCGQQDRHLSRKLGNAAYWISILAICLSFSLLLALLAYFTYQYLISQRVVLDQHLSTQQTRRPPSEAFDDT